MMNKKGVDLWVVVVAILAIALGVIYLINISNTNFSFSNFVGNVFSSKSTVSAVVTGCNTACDTGSIAGYCNTKRLLKFDSEKEGPFGDLKSGESKTCNELAGKIPGIEGCATITCSA